LANITKVEKCVIEIDEKEYFFKVEGAFFSGKNEILYKKENNIIEQTDWFTSGYKVAPIYNNTEFSNLKESVSRIVLEGLRQANVTIDPSCFKLEDYHKYAVNNDIHLKVINYTRNLKNEDFDIDFKSLEDKFSKVVQKKLSSKIKELDRTHIQIRLNRPKSLDINPPHRDGYFSYWKDILNIWLPIAGCNQKSSLPLLPESHLISENNILRTEARNAKINGNTYHVPCILKTTKGNLKMIRPNPKYGEALIFTPFLIHGAAFNDNENMTRVALELRFEKK